MKLLRLLAALMRAMAKRRDAKGKLAVARKICIQLEAALAEARRVEYTDHGELLALENEVFLLRQQLGWTWPEEQRP